MGDSDKEMSQRAKEPDEVAKKKTISMHEDIPVWYDCCSCEAEPYWVEAMNSTSTDMKNHKEQ